ncbi:protein NLRC3-like isoform X2 [Dysidea avara]|uniref:protein NLRC3-like isoform X2 n=1 Tax=Dysidea avara TaxID=196820 RepID=UPI0033202D96
MSTHLTSHLTLSFEDFKRQCEGCCNVFNNFVDYLRHKYKDTRYIPEDKEWPPNQPRCYVDLAVMHYGSHRTQEEVISNAKRHRDGAVAVDEITKDFKNFHITKNIVDIFAVDLNGKATIKSPRSILIEGAPGIGKTILLKEIAYCWAKGTILKEAIIVFHLYLRDPRFKSVASTKELVQYVGCYLEEDQVSVVTKKLNEDNGEGVIFLVDGLDEYSDALQNHFLYDLIHRKIFSKSIFAITSRPTASLFLHDKVDQRVEILGFGCTEQGEYITKSLASSPEMRKDIDKYLKQYPQLNALVYIPFHLSVLLFLFQQGDLPETLTELNKFFILHTIYRHLERQRHCFTTKLANSVDEIDDLPKPVYEIIHKLAKLAFCGLQNDQLVFTLDELKKVCPQVDVIPGAINGFGLLQAVQHYPKGKVGTTISFNFLHSTVQEFLAAEYVSRCTIVHQKRLLKQSYMRGGIQPFMGERLDDSIAQMWQMYLGIVGVNSEAWVQFTIEHGCSPDRFKCHPLRFLYYFQCLVEGASKNVSRIASSRFITPFEEDNTIRFSFRTKLFPHYIALLCSFISRSTHKYKIYNFCESYMGDTGVQVLANFLLANKEKLTCISSINLSYNYLTSQSLPAISDLIQHGSIVTLTLANNELGESGACTISTAILTNSTVKELDLSSNGIGVSGAQNLAVVLRRNSTLETLNIRDNEILDNGTVAIGEALKGNKSLKELDIYNNNIMETGAKKLAEMLDCNSILDILTVNKECVLVIKQHSQQRFKDVVIHAKLKHCN